MEERFVSIVGAGPGAPDLLTWKGMKRLEQAKVVLHDALIHEEILNFCPKNCVFWDVGKKYGEKSMPQSEINELMVKAVDEFGQVVRLKGGDPSVFGRLKEEIETLEKHGIDYEIVPGISSSIGVLTDNLIPVTTRGVNESFMVSTAAKPLEDLQADVKACVENHCTLILLMSMSKLRLVEQLFGAFGGKDLPAVIIQDGTMPNQRKRFCKVSELGETAAIFGLKNPSIVAIGEVVRLGENFVCK